MPTKQSIQNKASPKFKHIFSPARKPRITAVPKILTAEAGALWQVYKFRTELNEVVSAEP